MNKNKILIIFFSLLSICFILIFAVVLWGQSIKKEYTEDFILSSLPDLTKEEIKTYTCDEIEKQWMDHSIDCRVETSTTSIDLEKYEIIEEFDDPCSLKGFQYSEKIRTKLPEDSSLVKCGTITNIQNEYDQTTIVVVQDDSEYIIFLSANDE